MALNKQVLKTAIKALLTDMAKKETDSSDEFAERLSNAIDIFVKSGTVNVTVTTQVTTAGTALAQSGAGIGTGTGNII